eukprot:CAMPEP_0204227328 /NCGR_PEP_ID=MMETSP0361-20130328/85615_1 /ASSEMBLY_ACC=CAM_ASM_000343 /TAXON_ID=268821 /ORGANISM="Scrippsiella Hangoei, Strain SHTV-5" /LENGTH=82 /DNA_ID=CAMNT_0051194737 /DNA_START=84 /DNA_END=329 /DNA_ORIENTATION=-
MAVPDWALAMFKQTSSTDKQSRIGRAAEHTKTLFFIRPQPVLLSTDQKGTHGLNETECAVTRMPQQFYNYAMDSFGGLWSRG